VVGAPDGVAVVSVASDPFEIDAVFTLALLSVYSEFVCAYGVPPTPE
jgi:hypothetical protein